MTRCSFLTEDGRPCSNEAVGGGLCTWHLSQRPEWYKKKELLVKTLKGPPDASATEKEWQAWVLAYAEANGWKCFTTHDSRRSPAGDLDIRMARPPRVLFVECKTEGGKLTPEQRGTIAVLEQCPGVEVYVFRPSDAERVKETLK